MANTFEEKYNERCEIEKAAVQPKIVLIGSPVSVSYVIIAGYKYMCESPKAAIDTCMAFFLGLNIQYPKKSQNIWYFLQKFLYKINTPYDKTDSAGETLFNDLTS